MKIAILSDIHGNKHALDAVISSAKEQKVDMFIVAGDLVVGFADNCSVIDTIKPLTPHVIKGNREEYLLDLHNGKTCKDIYKYLQYNTLTWTYENLDKTHIAYIESLNEQLSIKINNYYSIRVCHGSPFKISEPLNKCNLALQKKAVCNINENILICGHSHMPFSKWIENKLIINSGSVGLSYSSFAEYWILNIEDEKIDFELKYVKYDYEKFKSDLFNSDFYKISPTWVKLSIKSMELKKDYLQHFINKSITTAKENNKFENGLVDNSIWESLETQWSDFLNN